MTAISISRRAHRKALKAKLHRQHHSNVPSFPDCLKVLAAVVVICIALAVFALGYWVITMFGTDVVADCIRGLR